MCNSLISIVNPSRSYQPGLDKNRLFVPCNCCSSCYQQKQNDIYVRLIYEYNDCVDNGGIVYFPTLTYDEEHLPMFYDASGNMKFGRNHYDKEGNFDHYSTEYGYRQDTGVLRGQLLHDWIQPYYKHITKDKYELAWKNEDVKFLCPCFVNKDITLWRTKMRTYIKRGFVKHNGIKYYLPKDLSFRYSAFPQYGSKRTQRSHWHVLLFFNKKIPLNCVNALIQHSWIHGSFSWSKKYGPVVNSKVNAIKYVSRYASKDMHSYNTFGLTDYMKNEDKIEAIRPYLPKNLKSINCGASLLNLFKNESGNYDLDKIADKVAVKGDSYSYSLPGYYVRKMFFDTHLDEKFPIFEERADGTKCNTRYISELNDLGKAYKLKQLDKRINNECRKLLPFFNLNYLTSAFHDKPWDKEKFLAKLNSLRGEATLADIAIYDQVFRNVQCNYESFKDSSIDDFRDSYYDFYTYSLAQQRTLYAESVKKIYPGYFNTSDVFNSLPCFRNIDVLLSMIHDLECELSKQKTDLYIKKREKNILLRKQHNETIYI